MTEAQFGLLTSVFLWVYAGLSPFAGYLADRFSRSRVIILSLFIWSAVTWATGYATTLHQLLAARALMGISEACYIPAALALNTDYHRGATRSLATGVHITGITVGSGMGGIGGWLAERHGWSYAFILFGFIGVAHSLVLLFTLRDAPREGPGTALDTNFLDAITSLFKREGGMLRDAKVDVSYMFQFAAAGLILCAVLFAFVKPTVQVDKASSLNP